MTRQDLTRRKRNYVLMTLRVITETRSSIDMIRNNQNTNTTRHEGFFSDPTKALKPKLEAVVVSVLSSASIIGDINSSSRL